MISIDRTIPALKAAVVTIAAIVLVVRIELFATVVAAERDGTWVRPGPWVDWQTYANAFVRATHGLGIYAPSQLSGPYLLTRMVLVGYAYPPASVPFFGMFANYPFGLGAWLTLNVGLLFTALWTLISRAWPRYRLVLFAVVIFALAYFDPFLDGVISASVNVGIAGMVGWVAVGASPVWLGVFGALGAVTKIFPAVFAAAGAARKGRSVAIGIGVTSALCVLTLPIVGAESWLDFVRALSGAVPDCYPGNFSIACDLAPSVGIPAGTIVGALVGGAAALALLVTRDTFWLAVLASIAIMAPVTNLHLHHWIVAPVLLLAGLAKLQEQRTARLSRVSPTARASES